MIKMVYEENLDIRILNNLKRNLLDSKNVEGNFLPLQEYLDTKNRLYKGKELKIDELLLKEIQVNEGR